MGIFKYNENELPNIEGYYTQDQLGTSINFHRDKPLNKMIKYVSGSPYEIEYFMQNLNVNSAETEFDVNSSIGIQNYTRISKLVVYVTSPIDSDVPENLKFTCNITANFLPNKYDVAIVTLTGGRIGLFEVNSVEVKHYNNHNIYNVSFVFKLFIDKDANVYNALIRKVNNELVYNRNAVMDNSSEVMTRREYAIYQDLESISTDLLEYYMKTFTTHDNTLALPVEDGLTYTDELLRRFIYRTISVVDFPKNMEQLRPIEHTHDKRIKFTIFDVIAERNIRKLSLCTTNISFVPTSKLNVSPTTRYATYLGIDYIADYDNSGNTIKPPMIDISTKYDKSVDYLNISKKAIEADIMQVYDAAPKFKLSLPKNEPVVDNKPDDEVIVTEDILGDASGIDVTETIDENKADTNDNILNNIDSLNPSDVIDRDDVLDHTPDNVLDEPKQVMNVNPVPIKAHKQYKLFK